MLSATREISVKGRIQRVPAIPMDDIVIVTKGRYIRVAEIFDEYWLEAKILPDSHRVLQRLQDADRKPDLFTFSQRVPDIEPRFNFHMEWGNTAVIPVSSYDTWFREQISSAARRNIRATEKKGVIVKAAVFDEKYIHGIMSIYNESPFKHGKKSWHYRKNFAAVQEENGTYRERSTFLGAYFRDELIGYMKIVWDRHSAAIMQILSKNAYLEKRPNNALLSEGVRLCSERGIHYLLYERFVYGNKGKDSLTRFKEENGFIRMDLPRYYVPLTPKGSVALKLGLHRESLDLMPSWLHCWLISIRDKWYASRMRRN